MNESQVFHDFSINKICRVCLKSTKDLSPMSDEHIHLYRTFVDEVAHEKYNMKTCTICQWLFHKFNKFKHQCQSANNLLREVVYMDSKSLLYLHLKSSHHVTQTLLETHYYNPVALANDTNSDIQNTHNIHVTSMNETYNDTFKNGTHEYDTHKNDSIIAIKDDNDTLKNGTHENNSIIAIKDDNECVTHDIDSIFAVKDDEYDTHENGNFTDNDEDELPLVLLRKNCERATKKSKKKKKIKNIVVHQNEEVRIKEELEIGQVIETSQSTEGKRKKKTKKELRVGFTSRMVQETDEYIVIKLTKEQVLQEMEERSKTDTYLRSPFRCEKCVKGFNFEDVLQKHREKHLMENGSFECEMCGQYCPTAISLRGHVKSHTTRYKCKICGQIRLSRQHLLEHYAITHTGAATSYNCDYCKFTTTKRTVMQRHVRRHAAGEPQACDKCGKLFQGIQSLRLHSVRHEKTPRFKCSRCDDTFIYQSLLRKHVLCVHERRDFYCVECDVQFKRAESLRLHYKKAKKHRDPSTYKHVCPHCPSRFFTSASLAAHLSSAHNEPRAHACPHCRRLYSSREGLRSHAWRAHARGDPRAVCPHCGISFARKSTLKLHICTHTEGKAYECHCGETFAQRRTLQAHAQDKHKEDDVQQFESKIEV